MKIALSILLGLSVLLNIVLGGYLGYRCFFERERETIVYKNLVLSDDQLETLKFRAKHDFDILEVINHYHRFIKKVKGKKLIIVEE